MSAIPHHKQAKILRWPGLAVANHPNLTFWLSFVLLNGLLFLPFYLFNRETSSFLPIPDAAGQSAARQLFLWRDNLDIFRLSLEVTLLAALWVNVLWLWRRRWRQLYRALFTVVYVVALSYAIYESIFLSLYQIDPNFFAQYRMAVDGVQYVVENLHWPWTLYAGGALLLLLLIAVVLRLTHGLIGGSPPERLSRWTRLGMGALAAWAVLAAVAFHLPLANPESAVSSLGVKLQQNVAESLALRAKIAVFDSSAPQRIYNYSRFDLEQKPDVYLIFVESYGSVLYKRPDWRKDYEALLGQLEQDLAGGGWHVSTALSDSPTWGGGSWMAYTSAMFGLGIDSHPEYLFLLDEYQNVAYPDLGRYLQSQGYYSLFVSSIAKELKDGDLQQYLNFYGVDDWLTYGRLDYQGPRYGWGPAPPDQYVLWYVEKEVAAALDQPKFIFTITQNSHYPWVPQPELANDWRTLNRPTQDPAAPLPDQIASQAKRRNYMNAVDYQLRFLTDFILKNGRDNAVYVLIGDHQPQQVSRREDGFETPVHIISRDAGFVDLFRDYGFVDGLMVKDIEPSLRHEGFYSLFVRGLLASYGQDGAVLPDYLPNGIVLDLPDVGSE
jgi:hypothetical protein